MRSAILLALLTVLNPPAFADEPFHERVAIFPYEKIHNHASCVVEAPNGDLLVAWYRGSGERTADDVEILGARLRNGESEWEERFVLADTPDYPDCNPALFVAPNNSLWLFWPTILDHRWEGALLKYQVAKDFQGETPPEWSWAGVLHVTPEGFAEAMEAALEELGRQDLKIDATAFQKISERSKDKLYQRLGWMPRVRPTVLDSGRWLLPLYTDTFSCSLIAYTDDEGETWQFSAPIIGFGNIQPAIVQKADGSLVAFMRDNGPFRRIRVSTSNDEGETWSAVESSEFPNPGAGIDAIRLDNGHWALVYNDTTRGRHSLAVSISDDEGSTWKWTRHLEDGPEGQPYHYPSILQGSDGTIHVTYTHGRTPEGSSIRHARFNEAWVQQGHPID